MKRTFSLILSFVLLLFVFAPLSGCNKQDASDIKGIFMVSGGVVLVSNTELPLTVKVYDRYGEVIYDKLKSATLEDFPQLHRYVTGADLYFLDFAKIAEISQEGSYKCRYSVQDSKTYLEHTYIISPSEPENVEIYSSSAKLTDDGAVITVNADPYGAPLLKVWTEDVPENERFSATALECISTYEQIVNGEMIFSTSATAGSTINFVTRAIYSAYSYMPEDITKLTTDDVDFVSEVVCLDLLNPNDTRVANLGNNTHMKKFTIYTPGSTTNLATVYITPPPTPLPPPKLTAELVPLGNRMKLTLSSYPNVAYYRAIITELCDGVEKVVFNDNISPARQGAQISIRTDKPASYRATVYAKLNDGTATNRVDVPGFTTSVASVPTPTVSYKNGEVTAVFPRKANVTVWRSGTAVSTDTLLIGNNGVYSYVPDGSGDYGFIFKVSGNGAEIIDSPLIETETVTVK